MKVDVVTPDEEQAPEPDAATDREQQAAASDEQAAAQPADEAAEPEVLDAEFEPVEGSSKKDKKKGSKGADEVFSLADLEEARAEAAAANDRYLRLEAEWDNYRKRTARERESERSRAAESLVTKLLPVVDDMERALDHADKSNPEGEFGEFVAGVRAMHSKLVDVLAREGVTAIDPAGQPFNMHEHQAVGHVDDTEAYDETVRDVYQKGYRMGDRIIRTAMVTVTKGGPQRPADNGEGEQGSPDAEASA